MQWSDTGIVLVNCIKCSDTGIVLDNCIKCSDTDDNAS